MGNPDSSLLLGAAPAMYPGASDLMMNPNESKSKTSKNLIGMSFPNISKYTANKKSFKPLIQVAEQQRLDKNLNMDSDEEDIVGLDIQKEKEHPPQMGIVRRSQRISDISNRNKSLDKTTRNKSSDKYKQDLQMLKIISGNKPLNMKQSSILKMRNVSDLYA